MSLTRMTTDVLAEATGRHHRPDPVRSPSGGPAGNATLTAWVGLLLLPLIAIELVTLLDLSGLISWHVAVGVALIPLALLKTATTGWRILRYYTGDRWYRTAGPPPLLLRMLGPLVVLFTLAVLGSGLLLFLQGPQTDRSAALSVLGRPVGLRQLHAGFALLWAAVTGVHVLARLAPALRLALGKVQGVVARIPGTPRRIGVLLVAALAAIIAAVLVLPVDPGWSIGHHHHRPETAGVSRTGG